MGWTTLFGPLLEPSSCTMQVAGAGYRTPVAAVQREFDGTPEFRYRVLEYAQHQSIAANQIAACNRLHRAEARFARWLLMAADRLGTDDKHHHAGVPLLHAGHPPYHRHRGGGSELGRAGP